MNEKTAKRKSVKKDTKAKASDGRKEVIFRTQADPGSEVFVAGTFNDWDAAKHRMSDGGGGNFTATMLLAPGEYQYKFVVNGEWRVDSDCPAWVANDFGTLNSILRVL